MTKWLTVVKEVLPGLVVCVILGMLAKYAATFLPAVGAAMFAIGFGILLGNTLLDRPVFERGSKFSESRLLEYSIVLTGATLNLGDVLSVGAGGLGFILIQMGLTIAAAYLIGRALGFGKKFSLLMCAGNAVCGSSAIASVAPVAKADGKDKGLSITIVNVTGTFLMVLLPILSGFVYQHEVLHTSALIGGTLQSIGQVIASAKFVSDPVVEMATVFKIIRIIFLVLVALLFSRMNTEEEGPLFARGRQEGHAKVKAGVPWFIIGFFVLCVINSLHLIPGILSEGAHFVSSQFEIIALAAIGMRVKFKVLLSEGPKAMLYGALTGCCQVLFALGLIFLLLR